MYHLLEAVRQKCLSLVREEYLSIDEHMIPSTGRAPAKQFVKGKPSPAGLKNCVCCGKSDIAYDLILYQGKKCTGIDQKYMSLELVGSVVKTILESVDENVNHKVYFNNYFTSVDFVKDFKDDTIFAVVVIGKKDSKVMNDLRGIGMGEMDYCVNGEGDVIIVRYLDNGVVQFASTLVGIAPIGTVKIRTDRIQHIEITRPCLIDIYNDNMGGVDKLYHMIALYRIKTRTKKWTDRLIFHFVDFALVNAWLEYKRDVMHNCVIQGLNIWIFGVQRSDRSMVNPCILINIAKSKIE